MYQLSDASSAKFEKGVSDARAQPSFDPFFSGGGGGFPFVGICMLNPSEPTWPSRLLLKWHVQTDWEARWALAGVSLLNGVSRQRELRLLSNLLGKSLQSECPEEVIACLMLHYHAYFPIPERRRSQDVTILEPFLWQIAEILLPFVDDRLISSLITYIGALCIFRRDLNPPVRTNVHTRLRSTAQTPPVRISARVCNNLQLCMFPITHNQRTAWL